MRVHPNPFGFGESEFDQKRRDVPGFDAAWTEIQNQLRSEGASAATIDLAKDGLLTAYKGVGAQAGVTGEQAIAAAKQYVLVGKTVAGAVSTIQGLVQATQSGVAPQQIAQAFSGAMIGALVAAGAVSAGVGAAIVAGIGIAIGLMKEVGLFAEPKGVEICPGVRCDPAPAFVIHCVCGYGDVISSPSSNNWRTFPDPVTDPEWFRFVDRPLVINWRDGHPGYQGTATFAGGPQPRLIDTAFPDFYHLECESKTFGSSPFDDFRRAFFAAWKVNKTYAINGLKPVEDWKVLAQMIRMWNAAHYPGDGIALTQRERSQERAARGGPWTPCKEGGFVPYVEIVAREVVNNSSEDAPGGVVRINTGPLKRVNTTIIGRGVLAMLNAPAPSSSVTTKIVTGVAVTATVSALALAAYAYYQKITFATALQRVVSKVTMRENPIAVPSRRTSRGRRLAYRVRLDGSAPIEYVQMMQDGSAVLQRNGQAVARFKPSTYQLAKIRAGVGELLIYRDQIV